jgi:hypothetical protein
MPNYPTRALSTRDQAFVAALRQRPNDPRYARLADKLDPQARKPKPTPAKAHEPDPTPPKVRQPDPPSPKPPEPTPHTVGGASTADVKPPEAPPKAQEAPPKPEGHSVGGMSTADVKPGVADPKPSPISKPTPQPKGR